MKTLLRDGGETIAYLRRDGKAPGIIWLDFNSGDLPGIEWLLVEIVPD